MSSIEINKIVAAILTAGIVAGVSGFLADALVNPHELEEPVYVVAGAASDESMDETAPEAPDLGTLMAAADAASGEKGAKKCTSCHTFNQGGADKQGPNLWNIVNRGIGSDSDFSYSDALKGMSDQQWTFENLSAFLEKPKGFAPGTKMSFAGVKKPKARAGLLAYLRTLSDSPAPMPEPAAEEAVEGASEGAAEEAAGEAVAAATPAAQGVGSLLAAADAAAGEKGTRACKACHTFDQGGANKLGPNLWNIVNRPIAGDAEFKYSKALQGMSGQQWTYEDLDAFLTKPKDYAPGTKMSFPGVRKPEARANLIAYLRSLSDSPAPLPE
ncbi:MAG: cytochrome c family protein [Kiloniellales bacterium]|jgi:cytochrome c